MGALHDSQMCKSPCLWPFHEPGSPLKAFFCISHVWNLIIDSFTLHRRRLWAEPGEADVQPSNKRFQVCFLLGFFFNPLIYTHIPAITAKFCPVMSAAAQFTEWQPLKEKSKDINLHWWRAGAWQRLCTLNYPVGWVKWALIGPSLRTHGKAAFYCNRQSICDVGICQIDVMTMRGEESSARFITGEVSRTHCSSQVPAKSVLLPLPPRVCRDRP